MTTTILTSIFGSQLYGLQTPDSDTDYKSIYIPSFKHIVLHGPISHDVSSTNQDGGKNTNQDTDHEKVSVGKFLQFAAKGEMWAVDILHTQPQHWLTTSAEWQHIMSNRHLFLTKNMTKYMGYIKKQLWIYCKKGDRLAAIEKAGSYLKSHDTDLRLGTILDNAPIDGVYLFIITAEGPNKKPMRVYEVCGRQYQETVKISNALESLKAVYEEYGHRAHKAKDAGGQDFKAMSHAVRCCKQLIELYTTGTFSYPLPNSLFIKNVKAGKYTLEELQPELDKMFDKVNTTALTSTLPESIQQDKIDRLLLDVYEIHFGSKFMELIGSQHRDILP